MNILFDLVSSQPFSKFVKYNGGSHYVKSIFTKFIRENKKYSRIIYCTFDSSLYFDNEIKSICNDYCIKLLDLKLNSLEYYVDLFKIEKVFIGIAQRYLNLHLPNHIKLILVVHDLRDLEIFPTRHELISLTKIKNFKSFFKLTILLIFYKAWIYYRFKINLKRYNKLFKSILNTKLEIWTVSNHTKYTILSNFLFIDDKIINVYWSPEIKLTLNSRAIDQLSNKVFCLVIAVNNWEKNVLKILESFEIINKNREDKLLLVLVGDISSTLFNTKIKSLNWIVNLSNIENSEIEWLYSNAYALIYLSYVEGFGYPPVQAMRYGTPVLASATSSILEVCGTAPIYCNPFSKTEILTRLTYLLRTDVSSIRYSSSKQFIKIQQKQQSDLDIMVNKLLC